MYFEKKEVFVMTQTEQVERIEDKRNHDGNAGAFLLGSLIGGLTAAAAMLLYAPQSGVKTQEQIRNKASELRADAEKTIQRGREAAEDSIAMSLNSAADRLEKMAESLNHQAEEIKGIS
jgi:gas vesicle protein